MRGRGMYINVPERDETAHLEVWSFLPAGLPEAKERLGVFERKEVFIVDAWSVEELVRWNFQTLWMP